MYSEEICLAEWAIALITGLEPFPDTANVELILAVLTRHSWETFVRVVQNTIANKAFFNTFNFFVNVAFPQKDSRDNISISDLQQIFDCQHPFVLLSFCDLELLSHFDLN